MNVITRIAAGLAFFSLVTANSAFTITNNWAAPAAVAASYASDGRVGEPLTAFCAEMCNVAELWADVYALEPWLNDASIQSKFGLPPHDIRAHLAAAASSSTEFDFWNEFSSAWAGAQDAHTHFAVPSFWSAWAVGLPVGLRPQWDDDEGRVRYRLAGWRYGQVTSMYSNEAHDSLFGGDLSSHLGEEVVAVDGEPVYDALSRWGQMLNIGGRTSAARVEAMWMQGISELVSVDRALFKRVREAGPAGRVPAGTLTLRGGDTVEIYWLALDMTAGAYMTNSQEYTPIMETDSLPDAENGSRLRILAQRAPTPVSVVAGKLERTFASHGPLASVGPISSALEPTGGEYTGDFITTRVYKAGEDRVCVLSVETFSRGNYRNDLRTFTSDLENGLKTLVNAGCGNPNNEAPRVREGARIFILDLSRNGGGYLDLMSLAFDVLFAEERGSGQTPLSGRTGPVAETLFDLLAPPISARWVDTLAPVCALDERTCPTWRQGATADVTAGGNQYKYSNPVVDHAPFHEMARMAGPGARRLDDAAEANPNLYSSDDADYFGYITDIRSSAGYRWPTDGRHHGGSTFHPHNVYVATSPFSTGSAASILAGGIAGSAIGTVVQIGGNWETLPISSGATARERGLLLPGTVPGGNVLPTDALYAYVPQVPSFPSGALYFSNMAVLPSHPATRARTGLISAEFASEPRIRPAAALPPLDVTDIQQIAAGVYTFATKQEMCAAGGADMWTGGKCAVPLEKGFGGEACSSETNTFSADACAPGYMEYGYMADGAAVMAIPNLFTPELAANAAESTIPPPTPDAARAEGTVPDRATGHSAALSIAIIGIICLVF